MKIIIWIKFNQVNSTKEKYEMGNEISNDVNNLIIP